MKDFEDYNLMEQLVNLLNDDEGAKNSKNSAALQIINFIDKIPGGFLIYKADETEEIIYANRSLINLFRCKTMSEFRELTGNSFRGAVYREDLDNVEKSIYEQIALSCEDLDYVEYRIVCKDGTIRWVDDYGHFIRTKSLGDIFYVFISDATEIIKKNNMLIRQEHLQRLKVIEGLSVNYDSILYVDLNSNSVLPYRLSPRLTKQFEENLQIREYDWFVRDYVKTWIHLEDRERITKLLQPEYIRNALKDDKTYYANFKCVYDGKTNYLQIRLVDVGNKEDVSQLVIGTRNIEEEIENEIKQKTLFENALKESELANIAKNAFLSNMSHDMRTPLNAMFGYLELAKKNIDDRRALLSYIDKVRTASVQILDLVDKVLEISYLESKEFQLQENICSITSVISAIRDEILPQAAKKNIDVSLEYRNTVNTTVYADSEKLRQVLMHIVNNAVKYTDVGGKVTVIVEECPSPSSGFTNFRFIIKDTGIGIAEDSLETIFKPFERVNNSTHSGVFGSGLGLTIAKQIIDTMGGTITAESKPREGSTFTVTLSFKPEHKNDIESCSDKAANYLKGKKILLVEDNEINLEIETEMLEESGFEIDTAVNGKIAVEKVKNSAPDEYAFVLMDIQMPVMDGRQATEEIRKLENPLLARIPIIALSANALESDRRMSVKTGMDAHLTKPIDIPVLLKTVAKILNIK